MESVHQGTDAAGQPPLRRNELTSFAGDCKGFIAIPFSWGQILLTMADWCSNSTSAGAPEEANPLPEVLHVLCSLRGRHSTQLINSLIYIHSGFSMHHLKEVENCGGKLEEERDKTIYFVHGLAVDTACSVERKQQEISLLLFKQSEYILNIKTDFSSKIFLSPAKINVVWFGTLVILLANASVLFRY